MTSLENMNGCIWWNGTFVEWKDAKIHMSAHSLHYAGAVFEGIRIYNHKPFKLLEHYQRLLRSSQVLGYVIEYDPEFLCEITHQLIRMNNLKSGYVRPFAWRGGEEHNIRGARCKIHTAIISSDPFTGREKKSNGLKLEISKWKKPPASSFPSQSKTAGLYTMATVAQNNAVLSGFDDAIMLDQFDNIAEATTSNFFFIKNNVLYTPIPDCFLNGLTRQTVINEIAPALSIEVIESKFKIEDLQGSQAAFLTGTAMGISSVSTIKTNDERSLFYFSTNDPLLNAIQKHYDQLVGA